MSRIKLIKPARKDLTLVDMGVFSNPTGISRVFKDDFKKYVGAILIVQEIKPQTSSAREYSYIASVYAPKSEVEKNAMKSRDLKFYDLSGRVA